MTTRRLALAASTAALLVTASPAAAAPVTGGKLEWTMSNYYPSGDTLRTMLGYFTNTVGGPAASAGSVTPTAPATLTDWNGTTAAAVTTTSPTGLERRYTLGFPAASGDYTGGVATIETTGKFTFVTHGTPLTLIDPQITLDGTTGAIRATGDTSSQSAPGTTTPYDRSVKQFDLDLSSATIATGVDGSKVISGIVPIGLTTTFFPLTGRLSGTMKLTLKVDDPTPLAAPKDGATGPAGPQGPAGRSALIKTISLKRAPFAGTGEHRVKLLDRKTRAVLASGTVKKRTLRLMYLEGAKLKGSYTLRLTNGKVKGKRQATVSIG